MSIRLLTRWFGPWLGAILLAACGGTPAPAPSTPLPTPRPLAWDERAAVTLIRADRFFEPLSEPDYAAHVPDCVIYGDRRARWVEPPDAAAAAEGAQGRLMESKIDGAALDALVSQVADSGFMDLLPVYGPDLGPVRELTIRLEGMGEHTVQVAAIETAPAVFETLYSLCYALRQPEQAAEIIPTAAWLHVYPQSAPGRFHQDWPLDGPPLDALAEQPRWYTDSQLVALVWDAQRDHGVEATFGYQGQAYRVIARAEGITLDTPRAPRNQGDPLPPNTIWYPSPEEKVFVSRLSGGQATAHRFIGANAVDACTIYGDGRVITSEQPIGEVRTGQINRRDLDRFLQGWLATGFFDQPVSGGTPPPADMVVQEVTIRLFEGQPVSHLYPMNTAYLRSVRNPCDALTTFVPLPPPTEGYLWAEEIGPMTRFEADFDVALVPWPDGFPSLEDLSAPTWQDDNPVEGRTSQALQFAWSQLHGRQSKPVILFAFEGMAYAVYVDVPAITVRDAPIYLLTTPTPVPTARAIPMTTITPLLTIPPIPTLVIVTDTPAPPTATSAGS